MKQFLPLILLASISLTSCKNKSKVSTTEKTPAPAVEKVVTEEQVVMEDIRIKSPIVNKYWKAIEIMGKKVEFSEDLKETPYLNLVEIGSVSGHTGCNRFFWKVYNI